MKLRSYLYIPMYLLVLACSPSMANQHLILVGGGSFPPTAISKFVSWSGGKNSHILVISWATLTPQVSFRTIQRDLEPYDVQEVVAAPSADAMADKANKQLFLDELAQASGVFFTGGDQNRIMDVLKDEVLLTTLRKKYEAGAVFGGSSAGTAIMSEIMITGEGDFTVVNWNEVKTREGLGLLPGVIVDQHFLKRQRENRLMGLILHHDELLGVGIDQDTAIAIEDNHIGEVFGPTQVMMIDAKNQTGKLDIEFVQAGEIYDLNKRHKDVSVSSHS